MIRLLLVLLGSLTAHGPGLRGTTRWPPAGPRGWQDDAPADGNGAADTRPVPPPPWPPRPVAPGSRPGGKDRDGDGRRRRRIPRWLKWAAGLAVLGLVFRRAIAAVCLLALSAALHVVGVNVHLPSIRFAWPWQTFTTGTTTNADLGPWVLQKIEGISRPALGQANFTFYFTHKVSKNIGPWPCWYASTFYAVGHASATVDLNPGPAWWRQATGHYRLQVTRRPWHGNPGRVTVAMVLPTPQLPQAAGDVTIDNTLSKPISSQHSWTYPGLGCGLMIKPEFPESVLYAQAQQIAFYKASHVPQVTRPLIRSAEAEAFSTIRDNFIQPTVNAFGYTLGRFTIHWAPAP